MRLAKFGFGSPQLWGALLLPEYVRVSGCSIRLGDAGRFGRSPVMHARRMRRRRLSFSGFTLASFLRVSRLFVMRFRWIRRRNNVLRLGRWVCSCASVNRAGAGRLVSQDNGRALLDCWHIGGDCNVGSGQCVAAFGFVVCGEYGYVVANSTMNISAVRGGARVGALCLGITRRIRWR